MNKEDLFKGAIKKLKDYPIEAINSICETIEILDNNYGANGNVESDLGGYVIIAENIVDIEMVKCDKLDGLVVEYTDVIDCSEELIILLRYFYFIVIFQLYC